MQLADALKQQSVYSEEKIARIFAMPSADKVSKSSTLGALGTMILLDMRRPFQIAAMRRQAIERRANRAFRGGSVLDRQSRRLKTSSGW